MGVIRRQPTCGKAWCSPSVGSDLYGRSPSVSRKLKLFSLRMSWSGHCLLLGKPRILATWWGEPSRWWKKDASKPSALGQANVAVGHKPSAAGLGREHRSARGRERGAGRCRFIMKCPSMPARHTWGGNEVLENLLKSPERARWRKGREETGETGLRGTSGNQQLDGKSRELMAAMWCFGRRGQHFLPGVGGNFEVSMRQWLEIHLWIYIEESKFRGFISFRWRSHYHFDSISNLSENLILIPIFHLEFKSSYRSVACVWYFSWTIKDAHVKLLSLSL